MTAAAFKAEYADWKLIKTRSCVQVVFEVPIEQEKAAYLVLKGMPDPAGSRWFEISRLNPETASESEVMPAAERTTANVDTSPRPSTPQAGGANKKWDELSPGQQAGILCSDPLFQKFVEIEFGEFPPGYDCADIVRLECHVQSRADIKPGTRAAELWTEMVRDYRAWQREPEVVG